MKTSEVVQLAKENNTLSSDQALANLMKVSDVAVLRWRRNETTPKLEHAQRLAELAGIDPAPFVLDCMVNATHDKGLRRTLHRFKTALAAAAAALPALLISIQKCILCNIVPNAQQRAASHPLPPIWPGHAGTILTYAQ